MLDIVRAEDGWMWKVVDTEEGELPSNLSGIYTDKSTAMKDLDVYLANREAKLKAQNATRLAANKRKAEKRKEKEKQEQELEES
jgi:hypothetical protein